MARAAEILQGRYTLVVTNVPFLARKKQKRALRSFAKAHHDYAKGDIATVFVSRIFGWLTKGGTQAVVTPQSWLFQTTYRDFRETLLKRRKWNVVGRLGPGAFDTITGHVVNVALNIFSEGRGDRGWEMAGVDASAPQGQRPTKAAEKGKLLRGGANVVMSWQGEQLRNPDAVVTLTNRASRDSLRDHARGWQGIATSDYLRFGRYNWELAGAQLGWRRHQTRPQITQHFTGLSQVIFWQDGHGELTEVCQPGAPFRGREAWGRSGVSVGQMGAIPVSIYLGDAFDNNTAVVTPFCDELLPAVWCFCSSPEYAASLREIDHALKVTNATLVKVPFDVEHWKKVAADRFPNGLPEPYSNDPTQWIFHGHPSRTVVWNQATKRTDLGPTRIDGSVLQVAVARLLGYCWPAEDPATRLAPQQRDLAHDSRAFDEFADPDGIVCLSAARGAPNATDRLRALLARAYGDQWSTATERALLEATGPKPPQSLEDWLRDLFFQEHCKLFHNRPFIWHIWDGRKDGFHALVNYHRLAGAEGKGRRTLQSLTFAYLNEWIERQRTDQGEGVPGADGRLAAALDLQQQLQRIRTGEPPCDIFVRWWPLHEQGIGWEPDINDGVRLNIRPFMRAQLRKGGRAGAGILRWKPNVSWKKDRGKEPEEPRPPGDFPWFWGCPGGGSEGQRTDFSAASDAEFDGNRWNDLHYTRATKVAARERAQTGSKP